MPRSKSWPASWAAGPQSRIAERLRTKLGIPNEVTATWNAGYAHPGLFEISGSTKSVSTVDTIKAIQEEIDRIRTAEVTEDEWRNAREAAVNSLVFANDNRAKLFARQMTLDYYGYPKDYLPQYQKALQAVTRADVLRVGQTIPQPRQSHGGGGGQPDACSANRWRGWGR